MKNKQKDIVAKLTDKELLLNVYLSQLILLIISLVLSWLLFSNVFTPLQFYNFMDGQILTVGVSAACIVVLIDLILMKQLPPRFYDDGGINERLFTDRGVFHIFLMCICIAFTEELLFRGVIQSYFGLIVASIIFALVHYRYLFNWFLFVNIVLLSFFIGVIYEWTDNLAVTTVMHFLIDFSLGLFIYYKNKR
ncbi:CPBP family intramembrane glutamic endopeptidase [Bacillus kwashiorkori]|uniref:CPBP family intramembrane glutamic endopeptidase n=1 Tax=Bacillus kwashiorkori TaxID=1522318 RepID=UPI000781BDD2|nr:CPBP family intramembrane glutamic endopeptidase [Bacillus kwashiorkori]